MNELNCFLENKFRREFLDSVNQLFGVVQKEKVDGSRYSRIRTIDLLVGVG